MTTRKIENDDRVEYVPERNSALIAHTPKDENKYRRTGEPVIEFFPEDNAKRKSTRKPRY